MVKTNHQPSPNISLPGSPDDNERPGRLSTLLSEIDQLPVPGACDRACWAFIRVCIIYMTTGCGWFSSAHKRMEREHSKLHVATLAFARLLAPQSPSHKPEFRRDAYIS